jgi:transcriptional regulator with XRE-family HTH domain
MIGARIREIRLSRGLTQREVAEGAKVAKNYITMLETGWRKNCSLPVLRRIAKTLGVPAGRLIE